jgi:hypothetical protein
VYHVLARDASGRLGVGLWGSFHLLSLDVLLSAVGVFFAVEAKRLLDTLSSGLFFLIGVNSKPEQTEKAVS